MNAITKKRVSETDLETTTRDPLLLEIVLAGATGLTTGEGAFVVALSGMDASVASKVTTGGEGAFTGRADMFFLGRQSGRSRSRRVKLGADFRRFSSRHGRRRKSWGSTQK